MKNVYLVQFPFFNYGIVLPYAAGCLQSYCLQFEEINNRFLFHPIIWDSRLDFSEIVDSLNSPDVVAFSIYMWNEQRSLKLSRMIKERYPSCKIVFGGPSVPDEPGQFFADNQFIDFCIHKEGEEAFRQLLVSFADTTAMNSNIRGLSYRDGEEVKKNILLQEKLNPIDYPSPYLEGYFDHIIEAEKNSPDSVVATWETNRGCPYSCTFCDWGSYTNQRLRPFPFDRLEKEIEWLAKNIEEIYIADANFGIQKRDISLAKMLANQSRHVNSKNRLHTVRVFYAKSSNTNVVEIAKVLNKAKLSRSGVSISLQSTDPHVLDAVKRSNISLAKLYELKDLFCRENIPTLTELILGLPEQTEASFLDSLDMALQLKFSDINVFSLIKIPNAEMFTSKDLSDKLHFRRKLLFAGKNKDENEYVDYVVKTNLIDKSQMDKLNKVARFIDTLHLRKWTYFLAWYCKLEFSSRLIDFYLQLSDYFEKCESSVVHKVYNDYFIQTLNKGRDDRFVGDHSPGGIKWDGLFFDPRIFDWLCVHENRETFYDEVSRFLCSLTSQSDEILDLVTFQKNMMLDSDYSPDRGKTVDLKYDWPLYFHEMTETPVQKGPIRLLLKSKIVGRSLVPIKKGSPDSLYNFAGGYRQVMDKSNCFTHNQWESQRL